MGGRREMRAVFGGSDARRLIFSLVRVDFLRERADLLQPADWDL